MGFVGGGSNIAIELPYPHHLLCTVLSKSNSLWNFFILFILFFMLPGLQRPVPDVCKILHSNVCSLTENLSDLTVALSQYDILLSSEILVSDMHQVSELLVPGFGHPVLLCQGKMPRARGMAAYIRDGYGAFCQPKFKCGCCEMMFFRVCGVRQNLYVFSLYRNPDQDNKDF